MRSSTVLRRFVLVLATLGLAATGCGSGDDDSASSLTVGVVGPTMQMSFAPYTSVPLDRGFFAEEGLEVEMVNLPGSAEAVDAVLAGQLDVALILSPSVLKAIETGSEVQVFYNHITRNFAVPHVPEDSPIRSVSDMQGKTVGVVSPGAGSIPQIKSLVEREGGDPGTIEFLPVGSGPDVAELVRNGDIDVVGLWDSVFASIEGRGMPLRPVSTPWFDELGFQGVFVASRQALETRADLFGRFGRAVAKSTVFTQTNPDAAVTSHWKVYPDTKPAGMEDAAARAVGRAALDSRLEVLTEPAGGWGSASPDEIDGLQQVLVEGGFLAAVLPTDRVWTDALVAEFNKFDEAAVVDAAKTAAP
jgi:NitT/TauT family transport system substrate-binding protein